ncbi:MAG TPA: hypothetical protein VN678_03130 [Acidobacteriaceae bacterium]|nr:hypothetical protein [Acidobacteriaceae bacterium]
MPPRRCDDTWPARGWRTSSARRATDLQPAAGCGAGFGVGVIHVVLLVFPGFLVVILIFLVVVFALDDQRVIFFVAFAVLVFVLVLVLKFVVILLRLVLIGGCGGGVLLVQEVEVFESEIADGLHGASPS